MVTRQGAGIDGVPFHYTAECSCSFPKVDVRQATEPLPAADQRIGSALRHPPIAAYPTRGMGEQTQQVRAFRVDTVWFEIDLPELLSMLPAPALCQ